MFPQITFIPFENLYLNKLYAIIEPHLLNPELSVSKLTRLIGMSRTDLHRKIKLMSGMSTTQFIRFMRLKKAVKLILENPQFNISQVAYKVGFCDQSYFTKCFHEVFGITPNLFRQGTTNQKLLLEE